MPPSNTKTILLIELLDNGQPYDAAEVVKRFDAIVGEHGGNQINAVGKKIVCTLSDPNIAAEAAIAMMRCDIPGKDPARPLARMCLCQLAAGMDAKEAHTQAVSAAVRELMKAAAGQVVTTQETAANLSSKHEVKFGTSDGKTGVRVFEIVLPAIPKAEEATRLASVADRTGKKVRLRWRHNQANKEMVLYGEHPIITFGRDDGNDIVSDSSMASRRHGRLEFRKGGIFLIDESTNGTFVFPETGPKFKVQRGEHYLPPRGYFCLGEEVNADNPVAISFVTVFSAS